MPKKSLQRLFMLLNRLEYTLLPNARILDFGCGAGATVYAFHDRGFPNAVGFDTKDHLELSAPEHRDRFRIGFEREGLPFTNDTFDLVISEEVFEHVQDQVPTWRELHRIMKPGGIAIHVFPGPYCLIEPHNYVPLGGILAQYWWYKLWAVLGVRNEFQQGLSATETARRNLFRFVENLNYVNNSCYEVLWEELGFDWKWIDQESFDTNSRRVIRWMGGLNRVFPLICWISRTFVSRRVLLRRKSS
jgi:SAM-dependent methyltransferase